MTQHISAVRNSWQDLQCLILFLQVFILVRVTLGKLVGVNPKLLDLLSDLRNDNKKRMTDRRGWKLLSARISYLHLLPVNLCLCQAVSFRQNRNYVDFVMQGFHTLHIQRSKADVGEETGLCLQNSPEQRRTFTCRCAVVSVYPWPNGETK